MEDYGDWIWDEAEYNFFMSLSDMAKLEYMYDYFNLDNDNIGGEFDLDYESEEGSPTTSVDVVLTDTHFIITCQSDTIMTNTIAMFRMDGYVLMFEKRRGDTKYYKLVGKMPPLSVN